jgi:Kdo2-lipid IVA lauroyltransferase/acyltransferase
MQRITYYLLRIFIFLFSLIPFRMLYVLSDALCFLFYHVVKYRYKVIKSNLERSFPDKSDSEIQALIKGAYRNLCDILLEGIKGFSMSDEASLHRVRFRNVSLLNDYYDRGQSVFILVSHYSNWEWGPHAFGLHLKHHTLGIVAPIKNPYVNRYIQKARIFEKVSTALMRETRKALAEFKDRLTAIVFLMDQSPSNTRHAHWVHFLNQKTACFHGPDGHARRLGYPVIFLEQQRVRRGFYEITLHLLVEHPEHCAEGEITEMYMRKLEEVILRKPEDWLWSHRRWKHRYDG